MSEEANSLDTIIRAANVHWIYDAFDSPDAAMIQVRAWLRDVSDCALKRLGQNAASPFSEDALINLYKSNPEKVKAFLQALVSTQTPEMLLMVWRVLQGMGIESVKMDYLLEKSFSLVIRLISPYGEADADYISSDIDDAALLRHFGIMKMGDAPMFDGFYALRIK